MSTEESATNRTLEQDRVEAVNATSVEARQSSLGDVTAERASITQSSVKSLEAQSAQFEQSSVFRMHAEHAVINQSAATFVTAGDIRMVKSNALVVRGTTNAVEGDLKTVFFVGEATGNVHTIFDRESALRFGAGLGAVLVVLGTLVRKIFR